MMEWSLMPWPSRRTLIVTAGALFVVLVAAAGAIMWYVSAERTAAAAYAEALTRVQTNRRANGGTPDAAVAAARQLEATLQRYPSARLAPVAAYELGNLRYDERQYAAARSAYEVALAKGAKPTIRTLARAGVAYTWEAEKDFVKAADAFQAALANLGPGDFLYEELGLDLARAQEMAGRRDQAIETYRRVLKEVPKSARRDEIRSHLARLGAGP